MKRLTRLAGATVMAASALTIGPLTMGSAEAATHCTQAKWDIHPDLISTGGFSFTNGTKIRTGGFADCTAVGEGQAAHEIDVHCARINDNNVEWWYVRDVSTGKAGWVARSDMNYAVLPPFCG
jgi:hypothetical protein